MEPREDLDGVSCCQLMVSKDKEYLRMTSIFGEEYQRTLRKIAKVAVDLRLLALDKEARFIEELYLRYWKLRELLESNERRSTDPSE